MSFKQILGLCHFVLMLSILIFATQNMEWARVELHTIGESRLSYVSPLVLGFFRLFCAMVVWSTLSYITVTSNPLFLTVLLRNGKMKMVSLLRTQRYSMFTVWCWTLQGFYFLLAAYCNFALYFRNADDSSVLKAYFPEPTSSVHYITWILFEVCFPTAFLVSSIVTFVLLPHAKKAKLPTDNFFVIIPLIMHNANILFMALEVIANQIPFSIWHFPFIWIYGISYIVFSWVWNHYHGYYFYFFLDYTRPGAIKWYLSLLAIVGKFFLIGYGTSFMMVSTESVIPSFTILAITAMIIKVVDWPETKLVE